MFNFFYRTSKPLADDDELFAKRALKAGRVLMKFTGHRNARLVFDFYKCTNTYMFVSFNCDWFTQDNDKGGKFLR